MTVTTRTFRVIADNTEFDQVIGNIEAQVNDFVATLPSDRVLDIRYELLIYPKLVRVATVIFLE